jgi:hypothetical protein
MKLILIVLVFVGGVSFCGWKIYSHFSEAKEAGLVAQRKDQAEREKKKAIDAALAAAGVKAGAVSAPSGPLVPLPPGMSVAVSGQAPIVEVSVGSYRFQRRLVPPAPGFLKDDSKVGMVVQTDTDSNSWVWIGSPVLGSQILDLAKSYDVQQVEMDLDFVLVLLNTEKLKSFGFSMFYNDSASWLTALSLRGDTGSLRLASGGWAVDLDYSNDKTGLSVLSQPVIRCLDGQPWHFATDSEIPVPKSEVVDGVVRRSVEFRKIGFGLEGLVRVVGNTVLLTVDQRNGSVAPAVSRETEFPVFNVQSLKTSCQLAFSEWSVLGGIAVEREESRRGFLRDSMKVTSDYLVVFCRPRLALDAPPKAVPVDGSASDSHPLLGEGVLPPKEWLDDEIRFVERKIKALESVRPDK